MNDWKIFFIIIILIQLVIFVCKIYGLYEKKTKLSKTIATVTGNFTKEEIDQNGKKTYFHAPYVEFNHNNVSYQKLTEDTSPIKYKVGKRIKIYYNPNNMSEISVNNFYENYLAIIILGTFLLIEIGVLVLL